MQTLYNTDRKVDSDLVSLGQVGESVFLIRFLAVETTGLKTTLSNKVWMHCLVLFVPFYKMTEWGWSELKQDMDKFVNDWTRFSFTIKRLSSYGQPPGILMAQNTGKDLINSLLP